LPATAVHRQSHCSTIHTEFWSPPTARSTSATATTTACGASNRRH